MREIRILRPLIDQRRWNPELDDFIHNSGPFSSFRIAFNDDGDEPVVPVQKRRHLRRKVQ